MSIEVTYFVHGTTTDNLENKSTGWFPGKLSELGINQSKELRKSIDTKSFDVVFCSDLQRAVDSANLVFENDVEIIKDSRLRECNYGDLNGEDSKLVIDENHIVEKFPNGESLIDVEERIRKFCDFLKEKYDNKKVAIVAHKAPQLALQVVTEEITWEKALEKDWRKTKNWKPGWKYIIR